MSDTPPEKVRVVVPRAVRVTLASGDYYAIEVDEAQGKKLAEKIVFAIGYPSHEDMARTCKGMRGERDQALAQRDAVGDLYRAKREEFDTLQAKHKKVKRSIARLDRAHKELLNEHEVKTGRQADIITATRNELGHVKADRAGLRREVRRLEAELKEARELRADLPINALGRKPGEPLHRDIYDRWRRQSGSIAVLQYQKIVENLRARLARRTKWIERAHQGTRLAVAQRDEAQYELQRVRIELQAAEIARQRAVEREQGLRESAPLGRVATVALDASKE